jgi:hypothetical protein
MFELIVRSQEAKHQALHGAGTGGWYDCLRHPRLGAAWLPVFIDSLPCKGWRASTAFVPRQGLSASVQGLHDVRGIAKACMRPQDRSLFVHWCQIQIRLRCVLAV